jgi:hypothetical protein
LECGFPPRDNAANAAQEHQLGFQEAQPRLSHGALELQLKDMLDNDYGALARMLAVHYASRAGHEIVIEVLSGRNPHLFKVAIVPFPSTGQTRFAAASYVPESHSAADARAQESPGKDPKPSAWCHVCISQWRPLLVDIDLASKSLPRHAGSSGFGLEEVKL